MEKLMAQTPQAPSRVPVFGSIEEEAEFWDTHDSTEFEEEWEPVEVEISPTLRNRFFLRAEVDETTLRRVRELARSHGLEAGDLVRRWIEDGLTRASATTVSVDDTVASPTRPSSAG
jgi:hypothetical protein